MITPDCHETSVSVLIYWLFSTPLANPVPVSHCVHREFTVHHQAILLTGTSWFPQLCVSCVNQPRLPDSLSHPGVQLATAGSGRTLNSHFSPSLRQNVGLPVTPLNQEGDCPVCGRSHGSASSEVDSADTQ